jgi:hypothetical protein
MVILNVVAHKRGQMAEVGRWKLKVIKLNDFTVECRGRIIFQVSASLHTSNKDSHLAVLLDRDYLTMTNKNRILAAD